MVGKLLTLKQEISGDDIFPNIKKENIPLDYRNTLVNTDTLTNALKTKQDKITESTVNPFVFTEDGTGIDLYETKLDSNGKLTRGSVVDQIPSNAGVESLIEESSGTAVIILSDEQFQIFSTSFTITFTEEQANAIKKENTSLVSVYYNTINLYKFVLAKTTSVTNQFIYNLFAISANDNSSKAELVVLSIGDFSKANKLYKTTLPYENGSYVYINENVSLNRNDGTVYSSNSVYDTLYLGKHINLFGDHSILVPITSTDTDINLYYHQVEIVNLTSSLVVVCYVEFYSSNQLPCDSLTDLKTLLGNTFKKGAFGSTDSGQCVIWITESDIFLNNQTNISLEGATFKDTVTTI